MKIGIQVSSFRPVLRTEEEVRYACRRMKQMGCDVVQLQWIDRNVSCETIARALEESELPSVSVQDFISEVCGDLSYYLHLNALTGGTWLCVSRIPENLKSDDGLYKYTEQLRELAAQAERFGQKLCFHPVSSDFARIGDLDPVETLLERMPELAVCADLYHLHKSGRDICAWLRRFAGRVCMVHFKDSKTAPDGTETLVPPGQGDIDWSGVAQTCLETGVEYAFAEQERWEGDPFDRLREGYSWLAGQLS